MDTFFWAGAATGFTCLMTALGAAVVLFFRREIHRNVQRLFLGFAAGVMIAASVWSLLLPAIEAAQRSGSIGWIPAAGGFSLGIVFLMGVDSILPVLFSHRTRKDSFSRTALLVLAVTLHNIPEGMAVGLSFAMAGQMQDPMLLASAAALALGIGIQNFPEGAAISLPLRQEGFSPCRAFWYGSLSGVVELLFGLLAVCMADFLQPIMPWLLSFAAGAMIYVVVQELIPEAHLGERSNIGTLGVTLGFVLMMVLDVALG